MGSEISAENQNEKIDIKKKAGFNLFLCMDGIYLHDHFGMF
jgi:hypothetical protein